MMITENNSNVNYNEDDFTPPPLPNESKDVSSPASQNSASDFTPPPLPGEQAELAEPVELQESASKFKNNRMYIAGVSLLAVILVTAIVITCVNLSKTTDEDKETTGRFFGAKELTEAEKRRLEEQGGGTISVIGDDGKEHTYAVDFSAIENKDYTSSYSSNSSGSDNNTNTGNSASDNQPSSAYEDYKSNSSNNDYSSASSSSSRDNSTSSTVPSSSKATSSSGSTKTSSSNSGNSSSSSGTSDSTKTQTEDSSNISNNTDNEHSSDDADTGSNNSESDVKRQREERKLREDKYAQVLEEAKGILINNSWGMNKEICSTDRIGVDIIPPIMPYESSDIIKVVFYDDLTFVATADDDQLIYRIVKNNRTDYPGYYGQMIGIYTIKCDPELDIYSCPFEEINLNALVIEMRWVGEMYDSDMELTRSNVKKEYEEGGLWACSGLTTNDRKIKKYDASNFYIE